MLSPSPSKITDLAIPGASPRPADLAAPAKLRNTRATSAPSPRPPPPLPATLRRVIQVRLSYYSLRSWNRRVFGDDTICVVRGTRARH
jgi:hypothetical protein